MQIKNIEKVLKKSKTIIVMQQPEESVLWFTDGKVCMPLYDFPSLGQDNIFALFSIPEDKQSKWLFQRQQLPDKFNFSDTDPAEELLDRGEISINYKGYVLEPLDAPCGMFFADAGYIKAFVSEDEKVQFFLRKDENGEPYIVVKSGMFVKGLIAPMREVLDEALADGLHYIADLVDLSLREAPVLPAAEQLTLIKGERADDL